ncbi:hypothetical protein [Streptomyces sp. SKN60]|uniref:hypothetical protein n=1 Tax=Streptomyces sp. SKN60 TaxID=2855506 RepID=UPI002247094F|nr:hypothetical protein [Streptomyces sp. SKN60]
MHGTRTTVTLLAGVAMAAALTGCVAVDPPPTAPAPAASAGSAASPDGQDVAPQIVQGPAREALEAALPDPPEPQTAVERRRTDDSPPAPARPRRTEHPRPSAVPQQQRHRTPELHLPKGPKGPKVPEVPRDRAGVCTLGQSYGGWSPDSPQARICKGVYGR